MMRCDNEDGVTYHLRMLAQMAMALFDERDASRAELAKLKAERDHFRALSDAQAGEPIDNGDGTVTAMKPVTYPNGLPVECVRSRREGDRYVECDGDVFGCQNSDDDTSPGQVWLILLPAPKPPESVTWEAPLVDGEWRASEDGWSDSKSRKWLWDVTGVSIRGLSKPAKLGRYRFVNGVGTLIEESK